MLKLKTLKYLSLSAVLACTALRLTKQLKIMKKEDLKVGIKVYADSCGKMFEVVDLSNISNGWVGIKTDLYDNLAWPITTILALN